MATPPTILGALLLSSVVATQNPQSGGPAIAVPVFVTATPTSPVAGGGGAGLGLHTKKAGFQALGPYAPSATSPRPDFQLATPYGFEVDAMSIGLDQIHADCNGRVDYAGCGCWSALLFSVEDGTGSSTATGVVAREHAAIDGAGADVFSYASRDARLPAALRGRTERALDSRELGLYRGGPTPTKGQLNSVDAYMSLYELDDDVFAYLDPDPVIYFSVTNATKHLVPAAWWNGTTPSGGTILRVRAHTGTIGVFTPMPPLYTYADLGLTATAEIDALAVDARRQKVVLSLSRTTTPPGLSQILYVSDCVDGTPTLVDYSESDPNGTGTRPIADGTGSGGAGEVRGVCEWDPAVVQSLPGGVGLMAHIASTPQPPLVPFWTSLQAAAYRSTDTSGIVNFSFFAAGAAPGTGSSAAFVLLGFPGTGIYETIFTTSRIDPIRPVSGAFVLPVVDLVGFPVDLIWVDSRSGALAISHPLRIHL